jgi:hypothetical protein
MTVFGNTYGWQVGGGKMSCLSVGTLMIGIWWRVDVIFTCRNT